jgi:Outer membrane protein beta-barrel domain
MALGYQVGTNFNVYLSRRFEIGLEIWYRNLNFQFKNDNLLGFVELNYTENQTLLEVPLLFKFNFGDNYNFGKDRRYLKNRLNPYVFLGGSVSNLLSAKSTANRRDQTGGESTPLSIEDTDIDMADLRRRLNYNAVGGLGIEYKRGRNILALEVRYNYNLQNIVKPENRYNNNELIFKYGYVDNDMLLNNLSFNIAYLHPLYKIREKKSTKKPQITGVE